jgi:hypothetical protein
LRQEIEIVCKRNEVRSPFLASFLKLHLPDAEMSSSGVLPVQKRMYDHIAKNIAAKWGFEYKAAKVTKVTTHAGTRTHLPVDSFVQSELEQLVKPEQILRLNLAENPLDIFTPLDPYQHAENEMKFELAKLLSFGVQQLRQLKGSGFPQDIEAIIPRNPASTLGIFAELEEMRNKKNIIVVDASLKVSRRKLIQAPEGVIQVLLGTPIPGAVYSSIFEFLEPEKILCSLQWRGWLAQLTEVGKVIIVTPPLEDEEGNKVYDSHLAAIWAEAKNIA